MSRSSSPQIFYADAVLFDMVCLSNHNLSGLTSCLAERLQDGTLTDSTPAIIAAWDRVAQETGLDLEYILAFTHGKRAADSLPGLKPHITGKENEIDDEVRKLDESILFFSDAYWLYGPGSKFRDPPGVRHQIPNDDRTPSPIEKFNGSPGPTTPYLTHAPSKPFSSFGHKLPNPPNTPLEPRYIHIHLGENMQGNSSLPKSDTILDVVKDKDSLEEWQLEAANVDRAIQILPGVKKIINSIPDGRYAVATSATKTFGNSEFISLISS